MAAVATNKQSIVEDVAAIASAARQLQPLLSKAEELQSSKNASVRSADGPAAAQRRAQQMVQESGASLQELKDLNHAVQQQPGAIL